MKNQVFPDYPAALDFLYQQLPMYQRVGARALKPGLDNIQRFLAALGNPQDSVRSIHIAGTNGKGSTSHMLAAILQASGQKTGLYTSPHYQDFRERVKIDGHLITEAQVLSFVNDHYALIQEIQPSYFELTVALAFTHFAVQAVDVAVIETGLGGRLDSTNVIQPVLSVITNIGYDHQDVLGDTLTAIATEKAGIIKANTPVVIGHTHPETQPVFEAAAHRVGAGRPVYADQIYQARIASIAGTQMRLQITKDGQAFAEDWILDALGTYQLQNVQTVLAAAQVLGLSQAVIAEGLAHLRSLTYFIGRWQVLATCPLIIADSGHNEAGFAEAMQFLRQQSYEQLYMVLGFAQGKAHAGLLASLPRRAHYYWTKPDVPRGLPLEELRHQVEEARLSGDFYPSVALAVQAARRQAQEKDLIFIGGSSFMVADALHLQWPAIDE